MPDLTTRQRQIAGLVAEGLTSRQIARRLAIAPRTAEAHVEQILMKLDLHSRAQLATWWATQGQSAPAERLVATTTASHQPPHRPQSRWPATFALLAPLLILLVAGGVAIERIVSAPASASPGSIPDHGELLYRAALDGSDDDLTGTRVIQGDPDRNAVVSAPGSVGFHMYSRNAPAVMAADLRIPALTTYVAEMDVNLDSSTGIFWIVRTGDGAGIHEHAVRIDAGGFGVGYGALELDYISADQTAAPAPAGEVMLASYASPHYSGSHRVTIVVDPPRYVMFFDRQSVGDACDTHPGRFTTRSGMRLVARSEYGGGNVTITGLHVFALATSQLQLHLRCQY